MKINKLDISDLYLIEPEIFKDDRGFFYESFNKKKFLQETGIDLNIVQENQSYSKHNVLRGLHYQIEKEQGKLIKVNKGSIFDVAVDIRKKSPTFGHYFSTILSEENKRQLWIPEGFAHGFYVTSNEATVLYKINNYWDMHFERSIIWSDNDLNINWPFSKLPILSVKDQNAISFKNAEYI